MKYRSDFVTNSSSSSYIVAFKDANDMMVKVRKFIKKCRQNHCDMSEVGLVVMGIIERKLSYAQMKKEVEKIAYINTMQEQGISTLVEQGNVDTLKNFSMASDKKIEKAMRGMDDSKYFASLSFNSMSGDTLVGYLESFFEPGVIRASCHIG